MANPSNAYGGVNPPDQPQQSAQYSVGLNSDGTPNNLNAPPVPKSTADSKIPAADKNTLGPNILTHLEQLSNLSLDVLKIIKGTAFPVDYSKYAAKLAILCYGHSCIGQSYQIAGSDIYTITKHFYIEFITEIKHNGWTEMLKNTPAGKKNELKDIGLLGGILNLTAHVPLNPVTGPSINTPCFVTDQLNKLNPNIVPDIERVCNAIRTHSYLSLPTDSQGGIAQALWYITGAVAAFYRFFVEIYQGMQLLVQQFYIWFNSIMRMVQNYIISLIEKVIPLSLLCLILDAVQTLLDDVAFFGSLFGGSDNFFQVFNAIQTVVNYASFGVNFAYNPIGGLASLFPAEANKLFNFINSIGQFPTAFLAKLVSHFSFGATAHNSAIGIANAIIQHYGLGAQLGPMNDILQQFGGGYVPNNSKWYRTGATGLTTSQYYVAPAYFANLYGGNPVDINGHDGINGAFRTFVTDFTDKIVPPALNPNSPLNPNNSNK
jgi:hypothetical protein